MVMTNRWRDYSVIKNIKADGERNQPGFLEDHQEKNESRSKYYPSGKLEERASNASYPAVSIPRLGVECHVSRKSHLLQLFFSYEDLMEEITFSRSHPFLEQ